MHGGIPAGASAKAKSTPLADLHPGDPELFRSFAYHPVFERLRAEESGALVPRERPAPIGR